MTVDTSNMTLDELDVFRFKDRLISILETKGIKASHGESLSLLFSRCVSNEQSDWFVHTWSPSINTHSVTPVGLTTTATDAHLVPENGYTFNIPYPTNVIFRDRPVTINAENIKPLTIGVSLSGTTTPDVPSTGGLSTILAHFRQDLNVLNSIKTGTEFDSILNDGILGVRTAVRSNGVTVGTMGLASLTTGNANGSHFQYEQTDTAFRIRVGQTLITGTSTCYLRNVFLLQPISIIIRKPITIEI